MGDAQSATIGSSAEVLTSRLASSVLPTGNRQLVGESFSEDDVLIRLRRRRPKAADANPHLTVAMDVLLDQETAPALRARKKFRPTIHVRHVEYLAEQVSLIRFLEGQEPLTTGSTTT